jgi:uncharacterized membrane protein
MRIDVKNISITKYAETNELFFRLVWVFITGCLAGFLVETVYCLVLRGALVHRGTLLYGPFSLVWGTGAVLMSIFAELTCKWRQNKGSVSWLSIFSGGFIIGGLHEYLSSLISELAFGAVNWDYSHLPLHIQGRTSLLYCIYWGLIALAWVRLGYPAFTRLLRATPWRFMKPLTALAAILMILNIYISCAAMSRYNERRHGITATTSYERFLDSHYDNEFMLLHYPDMRQVR